MALWRHHLTGWQPVHQCCFPSLPAVECGFIISSVDNFNFLLDAILQSARQTRTK